MHLFPNLYGPSYNCDFFNEIYRFPFNMGFHWSTFFFAIYIFMTSSVVFQTYIIFIFKYCYVFLKSMTLYSFLFVSPDNTLGETAY